VHFLVLLVSSAEEGRAKVRNAECCQRISRKGLRVEIVEKGLELQNASQIVAIKGLAELRLLRVNLSLTRDRIAKASKREKGEWGPTKKRGAP